MIVALSKRGYREGWVLVPNDYDTWSLTDYGRVLYMSQAASEVELQLGIYVVTAGFHSHSLGYYFVACRQEEKQPVARNQLLVQYRGRERSCEPSGDIGKIVVAVFNHRAIKVTWFGKTYCNFQYIQTGNWYPFPHLPAMQPEQVGIDIEKELSL